MKYTYHHSKRFVRSATEDYMEYRFVRLPDFLMQTYVAHGYAWTYYKRAFGLSCRVAWEEFVKNNPAPKD